MAKKKSNKLVKTLVGVAVVAAVGYGGLAMRLDKLNADTIDDYKVLIETVYEKDSEFITLSTKEVRERLVRAKEAIEVLSSSKSLNPFEDKAHKERQIEQLKAMVKTTECKLDTQEELSELFGQEVELRDEPSEDLVVNEDNDHLIESIEERNQEDTQFAERVQEYVSVAQDQLSKNDLARKDVEVIYKDDKVISTKEAHIKTAKSSVEDVKDEALNETLTSSIKKVEDKKAADDKARAEKEKKEKEQAEREAAEQAAYNESLSNEPANTNAGGTSNVNEGTNKAPSNQQSNGGAQSPAPKPAPSNPAPAPSIPDWGVTIRGVTAPIGSYGQSGGAVPLYTPEAYLWSLMPNYYLIDITNSLGIGYSVLSLSTGETVHINGRAYTVTGSQLVYAGDDMSVVQGGHAAYLQTCWSANPSDGMRVVWLD